MTLSDPSSTVTASDVRNPLSGLVETLRPAASFLEQFCSRCSMLGMTFFMAMVLLTFCDVFLRYLFGRSVNGTVEITELLMVIVVFSSIAHAQWKKSHVVMDVLTAALSEKKQTALGCATTFWSLAVVGLCVWTSALYAMKTTSETGILLLPYAPFIWFVVFGFGLLFLTLLWELLCLLERVARMDGFTRLSVMLGAILPVIGGWWLATHRIPGMTPVSVGCLGIAVMFVLFFSGMPVAFTLMASGFIFSGAIRGLPAAMNMYGKTMFATSASYAWAPLMFFMLMGYFCFYSNFGRDIYTCARTWLGHLRGGLAQGSVCACSAFGAVVGDVLSGSIAMSAIALPEMRRNKYDDTLAVGTLACSSTIGALIPPSTTLILYGVLAEQSIADLFMAGVFPGIICTICFMGAIWLAVYRNPGLAPMLPPAPMTERLASLRSALPIGALFVLVIGGIYGGIFTPTEGGGIGATGTLVLAIFMGRMNFRVLCDSFNESAKYITMCFTVLTGAGVLGYFMTLSRIPQVLAGTISALGMSGWMTMSAIILVLLVLGCFIPAMPLLLVCTPIFVPIAILYHWDLIWFGIIICLMINMAGITPPFGINLFVMKGLADVPLGTMYRSSIIFVVALSAAILIVLAFPETATWLPNVLK